MQLVSDVAGQATKARAGRGVGGEQQQQQQGRVDAGRRLRQQLFCKKQLFCSLAGCFSKSRQFQPRGLAGGSCGA
jgi:hypothetical protein